MARVTVQSEENHCVELCQRILEEYSELIQESVFLHVPHGKAQNPVPDGTLHIFIWSVPEDDGDERTELSAVFGYALPSGTGDAMTPSYKGVVIEDPDGMPVAEVLEKNIYILFDLVHKQGDFVEMVMREILDKAIPIALDAEVANFKETVKDFLEGKKAKAREQYIKECSGRLESRIGKACRTAEKTQEEIDVLQQELVQKIRIFEKANEEYIWLSTRQEEVLKIFEPEFDKLWEMPKVEIVEVKPGKISVFTKEIKINYKSKTYLIGKFRIDIFTDGSNGGVKMHNVSGHREEGIYDHPHVKRGDPCLGNIKEATAQLIGQYQFSVVAMLAIQYLESLNSDGVYRNVDNWPTV